MSFGGSVLAMIQSLKANARPKHKAYQGWNKTEELRFQAYKELWAKKVSPEELERIKTKFRKEIEIEQRRTIIVTILSVVIFVPLILFVGFNLFFNTAQKQETEVSEKTVDLEQINYLLNSGYEWINKKHYKNARYQFKRVLELQPENKTARYGMAASWVYQCQIDNTGCDEAKKRLDTFISDYGEDDSTSLLKEILDD